MAEGNGLENRRRETVPEFESLLLRHIMNDPKLKRLGVFRFEHLSVYHLVCHWMLTAVVLVCLELEEFAIR